MNDPRAERDWWTSIPADEVDDNLHGIPPYDVDAVADRIMTEIAATPGFAIGADMTMLDLGCGRGRLTAAMAKRVVGPYTSIIGVDIHERLLYTLEHYGAPGVAFLRGDGRSLPDDVPALNAAWSVAMFQHIPPEAMWGYIHQVHDRLAPGGVFTFTLAAGDQPHAFLNYQVDDLSQFGRDMFQIFESCFIDHQPDERGWTWVTATKER